LNQSPTGNDGSTCHKVIPGYSTNTGSTVLLVMMALRDYI